MTVGLKPDLVLAFVLLDLAIIFIAARLVGALALRVGQPRVVGEIVAGVLLGPTLLGATAFVWGQPWKALHCADSLSFIPEATRPLPNISSCVFPQQARGVLGIIGQIALMFFMFLVGLELDYSLLKGKLRGILTVAIGVITIPIALGFAIGPALYNKTFVANFANPALKPSQTAFTLFVAAMLSVTAFPVMARILQEKNLTRSAMGAIGVAAAAVVTVLMFLTLAVADGVNRGLSTSDHVVKFVGVTVFITALFVVVRPLLAPLGRRFEETGEMTSTMFATIVILMTVSAYVADRLGVNVIVGGFLAGAILPARAQLFKVLSAHMSELTGTILLPVFLAFSGLNTDFTKLGVGAMGGLTLFVAAGIVGKWLGGAVAARAGGLSWAEGNAVGILMNCRGLLVLVVALIAFQGGAISPVMQVGGVLMALITTAMTGPLFDVALKRLPAADDVPLPAEGPTVAEAMEAGPVG
ncbi:MAG: cation:proton antiporter [Actinobacteria bacterium]|nr:cation:proton antiporter [Actinomycetota bacterium]